MILRAFLFILFVAAVCYMQIKSIRKRKQKQELIAFLVCMGIAFVASVLNILEIPIPSPNLLLEKVFNPISAWIF